MHGYHFALTFKPVLPTGIFQCPIPEIWHFQKRLALRFIYCWALFLRKFYVVFVIEKFLRQ